MMPDPADDDAEPSPWDQAMQAHAESLVVGARVQVKLNGECPDSHEPEQDGATGIVDCIITQEGLDIDNRTATRPDDRVTVDDINSHIVGVVYDDPRRVPLRLLGIIFGWEGDGLFLPTELIVLPDDQRPPPHGETDQRRRD